MDEPKVLRFLRSLTVSAPTEQQKYLEVQRGQFAMLLRMAFAGRFDEQWYLDENQDVSEAVAANVIDSGLVHWSEIGAFEGRLPYPIAIDETDYSTRHRDVARSLETGRWKSASEHFYKIGFMEGRDFKMNP